MYEFGVKGDRNWDERLNGAAEAIISGSGPPAFLFTAIPAFRSFLAAIGAKPNCRHFIGPGHYPHPNKYTITT
jgi:hypothetical protein